MWASAIKKLCKQLCRRADWLLNNQAQEYSLCWSSKYGFVDFTTIKKKFERTRTVLSLFVDEYTLSDHDSFRLKQAEECTIKHFIYAKNKRPSTQLRAFWYYIPKITFECRPYCNTIILMSVIATNLLIPSRVVGIPPHAL